MIKYCFQDELLVFLEDVTFRPEVKHALDVFI